MRKLLITKAINNHLILNCKLTTDNYEKMNNFAGFTKWKGRDLWVRITPQNLEYIESNWLVDEIEFDKESELIFTKFIDDKIDKQRLLDAKRETITVDNYAFKREPMDHQLKAFGVSKNLYEYALFFEQGLGKTKVIIDNAAYLYQNNEIDMLVIIAWPNGLHINWTEWEAPEDLPDNIEYKSFYWKAGPSKKKTKIMDDIIEGEGYLKIASFNVEAFSSLTARDWLLKCLDNNRCMLVIDQSASIKNPVAKRTKFIVKKAADKAIYRRILDGAPVAENAAELFSQFYFLNWEIIGCDTYTAFKNEFCNIGRFNEIKNYRNLDRLMDRIEPFYYRCLEEQCLDLPKRVYKRFYFDLTNNERICYDEIKSKSLTKFEGELLETPLAIVKAIRLQQISSGWWPGEEFRAIEEIPSRFGALKLLLSSFQIEEKILIFSRFKADMEILENYLPNCVGYHGSTPQNERESNKKAFQLGDARILVGNPVTAGIGHTFTAASHVIFYSNEYSLRMRLESEKRVHRKGQTKRVHIWDLVANKTQDTKIISLLQAKKDVADMIMKDPESFFLEESDD